SVADMQAAQKVAGRRVEIDAAGAGGSARVVAGRTFLMRDGSWVDSRHAESRRTVEIRPFSEAYFAVLRALPETALVFRELDDVLIAGTKVSLKLTEAGADELDATELRRIVSDFR